MTDPGAECTRSSCGSAQPTVLEFEFAVLIASTSGRWLGPERSEEAPKRGSTNRAAFHVERRPVGGEREGRVFAVSFQCFRSPGEALPWTPTREAPFADSATTANLAGGSTWNALHRLRRTPTSARAEEAPRIARGRITRPGSDGRPTHGRHAGTSTSRDAPPPSGLAPARGLTTSRSAASGDRSQRRVMTGPRSARTRPGRSTSRPRSTWECAVS